MRASSQHTPAPGTAIDEPIGRPGAVPCFWAIVALLAGYFTLQAVSRGLITETLGMDEAEQALLAQKWSWGYGPQPPLYTWLVMILSKTMGLSSFSMALLKNLLLFGIYLLTYFNARLITQSHVAAVVAALALQFMPSIAYEAHRELTHSILASFMVLATLLMFLKLPARNESTVTKPGTSESGLESKASTTTRRNLLLLGLGIAAGLGIISKYNYSIFVLALILAGWSLRSWRPALKSGFGGLAVLIALLIIAPNLFWVKNHPDLALASMGKFDIDPTHSVKSMIRGIGSWAFTCLDQIGVLAVVFAVVFWTGLRSKFLALKRRLHSGDTSNASPSAPETESKPSEAGPAAFQIESAQLLVRAFLFTAMIVVLGIIVSGATNCRNRWLQPLVIPAPMLAVLVCQDSLRGRRVSVLVGLATVVSLVVAVAAPGRILLTERLKKIEGLNMPFRGLAGQIRPPLARVQQIYCPDTAMAGNLRIWFPDKAVTALGVSKLYPPQLHCALVWDPSISRLSAFVAQASALTGTSPAEAIYVESRWKYHHTKTMRLAVLLPSDPQLVRPP